MDTVPDGTQRISVCRAWIPTRMDDGTWLCWGARYTAIERLEEDEGGITDGVWLVKHRWAHHDVTA